MKHLIAALALLAGTACATTLPDYHQRAAAFSGDDSPHGANIAGGMDACTGDCGDTPQAPHDQRLASGN